MLANKLKWSYNSMTSEDELSWSNDYNTDKFYQRTVENDYNKN